MVLNPHQPRGDERAVLPVDYSWFAARFETLMNRLHSLEAAMTAIEQTVAQDAARAESGERQYYSTLEFAKLVGRSEYSVREWCRLSRIHAEKSETGRGEAKSWKIPAAELQRYRDHGLLPFRHQR